MNLKGEIDSFSHSIMVFSLFENLKALVVCASWDENYGTREIDFGGKTIHLTRS